MVVLSLPAQAAKLIPAKTQAAQERLVLMPLRVSEQERSLQGSMEAAIVEGLHHKYQILFGEQVAKKAREIFSKESRVTTRTECDETRCMQGIAEAFQAELLATVSITKQDGGYFLALSIQNIFDNKVVYSKSLPCRNCDAFQMVEKLKELGGKPVTPLSAAPPTLQTLQVAGSSTGPNGFRDCAECPELVVIPAGKFEMGNDKGESNEAPQHTVTIGKSFALGRTEVTQGQWFAIMGNRPAMFNSCGDTCPVENVSWHEVQSFIAQLNAKTGKHYRLPTESEWEYACRAGGIQQYCGGDDASRLAWSTLNSRGTTHQVARLGANAFGLHDMSGNVWEWVEDNYHDTYVLQNKSFIDVLGSETVSSMSSKFKLWESASEESIKAPEDGSAWKDDGIKLVLRGGSWKYVPQFLRAATRMGAAPEEQTDEYGFRLARDLP